MVKQPSAFLGLSPKKIHFFLLLLTVSFNFFPMLFLHFLHLAKLSTWSLSQFIPEPQLIQDLSLGLLIQFLALTKLFNFGQL